MSSDGPLAGVEAHRLLNSLAAIQGQLSGIGELIGPQTPHSETIRHLLRSATERADAAAEQLRRLAAGHPEVLDLDREAEDRADHPPAQRDDPVESGGSGSA
jgi:signal transduction histidine kinase